MPVLVLRFHPEDGSLLPKGLHPFGEGTPEAISLAEKQLRDILAEIVVLDGAEFREPESCWALPISHKGRIIGHIKVSSEGEKILPDAKASAEQLL
jgi:DNA-binding IclR family transcriptional regulator